MTQAQAMNNLEKLTTPEWTKANGPGLKQIEAQVNKNPPKEMTRDLVMKGVKHFMAADMNSTKKLIKLR